MIGNRFYLFLEGTWMAQQLPWSILFYVWGGWGFVAWGVCARVTAGVFGHWIIGYLAHDYGETQRIVTGAAVQGRNVRLTSLLTMGECWHNNHHAFPGSARLGLLPGEWDPGWWVLSGLRRIGLAWNLRLPEDLPYREELVTLVHEPRRCCTNPRVPAEDVWRKLVDVRDIRPDEVDGSWMYRIGVPLPVSSAADVRDGQHLRHIVMGKGIHFDQAASEWIPGHAVTWNYRFAADSFPPRRSRRPRANRRPLLRSRRHALSTEPGRERHRAQHQDALSRQHPISTGMPAPWAISWLAISKKTS